MACHPLDTKPLSDLMLYHYQSNHWQQISEKQLIKIKEFSFKKINLKMLSAQWWPFCLVEGSPKVSPEDYVVPYCEPKTLQTAKWILSHQ